jgi:hypothetical protein
MYIQRPINAEELKRLYNLIGSCVWHLQYLEDALVHLIVMKHEVKTPGSMNLEESKKILTSYRKNTLGTSLKVIEKYTLVNSSLLTNLKKFKDERDWLVHRSLNTNGDLLHTDAGREETFTRLENFENEAIEFKKALIADINEFFVSFGLNIDTANKLAQSNIGRSRT